MIWFGFVVLIAERSIMGEKRTLSVFQPSISPPAGRICKLSSRDLWIAGVMYRAAEQLVLHKGTAPSLAMGSIGTERRSLYQKGFLGFPVSHIFSSACR